jgi:hypothetical protein
LRRLSSGFVLGYHGCDAEIGEQLLAGEPFEFSKNSYDWLGEGVYFWESNPKRGLEFATENAARKNTKVKSPSVIGAVLDLGLCMDLATKESLDLISFAYETLVEQLTRAGSPIPQNNEDGLRRPLDCAVVTLAHELLKLDGVVVDSVRGVFVEGAPLYVSAGFQAKTHIQIAIRNQDCIKGVFRVPQIDLDAIAT